VTKPVAELLITRELEPSERLLWSGVPIQGLVLRGSDVLVIPFSLLWAGFSFFWEYSVLKQGAPGMFGLFGIPFVLVGIYIVVGRFFVDAWGRGTTAYALTDRRAVISSGIFSRSVESLRLAGMPDVILTERGDGRGTIQFGQGVPSNQFNFRLGNSNSVVTAPTFDLIEDARSVYDKLRAAQSAR
jgi:hypothetical protein